MEQCLQVAKVKGLMDLQHLFTESLAAQSCPALCNRMDCNLPGSAVHGILQASVLVNSECCFEGLSLKLHYLEPDENS